MIAVVADDLTGAAELGGLGLRYKLKIEIATEVDINTKADLLIISADTRSINEQDAVAKIRSITSQLLKLKPSLIYKKIDSVLRGHVVAELKSQMEVMQLSRCLVVPANPSLGRTIKDGQYYFNGEPIHLSSFSKDPEFPVTSSCVTDMLRTDKDVNVKKHYEALPAQGITVGEVEDNDDFKTWASKIDNKTLLAGASGFFTALLDSIIINREVSNNEADNNIKEPMLFACGTTFHKSRSAIKELKAKGGPVSYMPATIITSRNNAANEIEGWGDEVVELLSTNGKAVIAIPQSETVLDANDLREKTAAVVNNILQKINIKELVVEGGSTAASIIQKQNFTKLIPVQELSPGVIRMKVEEKPGLHLTIKPGSYDWSPELWKF